MRTVVLFLIIGTTVVAAAWSLGNLPGHVSASIGSITIETSASLAILVIVLLLVVIVILLRLLGGIAALPKAGAGWRRRHRLRLGERAITRVLVALAAGEQTVARKEARRARQLIGESPQTLLLIAEAGRLSGREDEAEEAFRALTTHEDGKFLGFRGLLRQAVDRHDWGKAEAIAREAEAAYPGTTWLRQQRAELAIQTDNWAEAAELSNPSGPRAAYYIAAADAEADPARSLRFARQAWKAEPAFAPAVLSFARRQRASGHERRAQSAIANAWKLAPHPDLADFALARDSDGLARFQSAKRLAANNPSHPESRLLLGKVAIEAGLPEEARHQADAAQADGLNERRLWLLIADIEEQERGDTEEGRKAQRDALRRAAAADPDPTWRCTNCRAEYVIWSAKCTSCGAVGTLRWQAEAQPAALPVVA
ncbi:heme biosynthesis HemY N-terminal domain-containing protein [Rhodopila sp.]|uniref:heme biosynthesis HemY N-terminal domain-containing protein n=1 Tax=Rhodopila sp. TaxID=2480087 RepID=UPI003D0A4C6A